MPTYKLNHAYESYRDGVRFGPWQAGEVVNLDVDDAEWVERDSPGALKVAAHAVVSGPGGPVPAAGSRPRVGGDPELDDAAAVAQERVHAEAVARQAPPPDAGEVEPAEGDGDDQADDEDGADGKRAKRSARDRQHRGGTNRSS